MRKRKLTDQEQLELETSVSMTPRERLDWLAMALEFTNAIRRPKNAKKDAT